MTAAKLTAQEVADVLRKVAAGRAILRLAEPEYGTWSQCYAGDVDFTVDGWRIRIFNDCDELDYVDSATAPDGRSADYDDWPLRDPVTLLTHDEYRALERAVEDAR